MFNPPLFLGLPLTPLFLQLLSALPPQIYTTFVQDSPSDYLQKVEIEGAFYLGKCLATPYDVGSLDALKSNIYSLLKKLVPDFPYEAHPLRLFVLSQQGLE